ncbi:MULTISPECIES: EpsG family protein [unclassified Sphingomonas]|uniref:EpsG family protein n=1 Tax=unclassified Sphingomonas TaxID=196159 RepID=UPI000929442B|nr:MULTISPECIES: EpsG family protein [unclassified Sphingomonas]MBN8849630.1 EpsG family protein [Sphingomonas sp.]OJV27706.1 MAG: hypothetical protein BGO24_06345 [Sphingomonas sp. 67-36]
MILAYLVYFGLLIVMVACWSITSRTSALYPAHEAAIGTRAAWFTIVLFTLLIGCRYGVGGDFFGYIYYYQSTTLSDRPSDVVFEPGFLYLIQLLKVFDAPDRSIIIASSFLQIFFFAYWLKNKKAVAPFIVYFFVTLVLLDVNNAVRQSIAIFAILLALDNLSRSRILHFIVWGLVAYLFHRSALIIFPLSIGLWYFRVPKVYLQLAALVAAYLFVGLLWDRVIPLFERMSPLFGYEGYSDVNRADLMFGMEQASLNIGRYLWPIVDGIIMIYSRHLTATYDRYGYRFYHGMFLIAALLQPVALAWNFLPFGRALFYFTAMRMICLGFLACYCLVDERKGRNIVLGLGICAVFATWLAVAVSRGAAVSAPYEF